MTIDDLNPETRMLEGATGTPVVLGDGNTWLLADGGLCNYLDSIRDTIDDMARLRGEVEFNHFANVALELLVANYRLTIAEAATLIVEAETKAIAVATMEALFGPEQLRRTYTVWAASSMLINGIDPTNVPGHLRPHVLAQLETLGRCVPRSKYIESAEAAAQFAAIKARIATVAPKPNPVATEPQNPAPTSEQTSG